jgi:hypothetical protein
MRNFAALAGGASGELVQRLPLTWWFRRGEPLPPSWEYEGPEGPNGSWDTHYAREPATAASGWRQARTDLYLQAQGILGAQGRSQVGHYWYQTPVSLSPGDARGTRIYFPGLFNEAWLYVNGVLVAHREYREPWWLTDYKFDWNVDLDGRARAGANLIALRGFNPHHMGGMFRRPFLYRRAVRPSR